MSYIAGIDYGTKMCGLARADDVLKIAIPWQEVPTENLIDFLLKHKSDIKFLVLGMSLDLHGDKNPVQTKVEQAAQVLKNKGFKVEYQDERFTTQGARALQRIEKRKTKTRKQKPAQKRDDASAATLILQSYLDKLQ